MTAEEGGETGASLTADFDQLHGQIDLFMKKIVQPKDVATTDSGIGNDNNPDEGETNSRSRSQRSLRSDSNVSKKSELDDIECLFEVSLFCIFNSCDSDSLNSLGIGRPAIERV